MSASLFIPLARFVVEGPDRSSSSSGSSTSRSGSIATVLKRTDEAIQRLKKFHSGATTANTATITTGVSGGAPSSSPGGGGGTSSSSPSTPSAATLSMFGPFPPAEDFIHVPLDEGPHQPPLVGKGLPEVRFGRHPSGNSRGDGKGMTVEVYNSGSSFGVSSSHFSTIMATIALSNGRYQYEVQLETDGVMQVGWSLLPSLTPCDSQRGVGDFPNTYAFDGGRKIVWNLGQSACSGFGWAAGDVVTTALDLELGYVSFFLNGELVCKTHINTEGMRLRNNAAQKEKTEGDEDATAPTTLPLYAYCPSMSLSSGERCIVNLGGQKFAHPQPGYDPIQCSVASSLGEGEDGDREGPQGENDDDECTNVEALASLAEWKRRRSERQRSQEQKLAECRAAGDGAEVERLRLLCQIIVQQNQPQGSGSPAGKLSKVQLIAVASKLLRHSSAASSSTPSTLLEFEARLVYAIDTVLRERTHETTRYSAAVVHTVAELLTKCLTAEQLSVVIGQLLNLWSQAVMCRRISWPDPEPSTALRCICEFTQVEEIRRVWTQSSNFGTDFSRTFCVKNPNQRDGEAMLSLDSDEQYARAELIYTLAIQPEDQWRGRIFSALWRDEQVKGKLLQILKSLVVQLKIAVRAQQSQNGTARRKNAPEDNTVTRLFMCCIHEVVDGAAAVAASASRTSSPTGAKEGESPAAKPSAAAAAAMVTSAFAPTWALTKQTLIDVEMGRVGGRFSHVARTTPVAQELKTKHSKMNRSGGSPVPPSASPASPGTNPIAPSPSTNNSSAPEFNPLLLVACSLYTLGAKNRMMDAGESILLRQAAEMMGPSMLNEEQVKESEKAKLQCGWDYATLWAIKEDALYMKFASIITTILRFYYESPILRYIPEYFVDTWIAVIQYIRRTSDDFPGVLTGNPTPRSTGAPPNAGMVGQGEDYTDCITLLIQLFSDQRLNHDLSDVVTNTVTGMLDTYEPNRLAVTRAIAKDPESFQVYLRSLCALFGHKMAWTTAVTALMRLFGGNTFCNARLLMDDSLHYELVYPHKKRAVGDGNVDLSSSKKAKSDDGGGEVVERSHQYFARAFKRYIDTKGWNRSPKSDDASAKKSTVSDLLSEASARFQEDGTGADDEDGQDFMENLAQLLQSAADPNSNNQGSSATAEECNLITFIKNLVDHINFTLTELGAYLHDIPKQVQTQDDRSKLRKTASLFELTRGLLHILEFLVHPNVSGGAAGGIFVMENPTEAPQGGTIPLVPSATAGRKLSASGNATEESGAFPHLTRATSSKLLREASEGVTGPTSTKEGQEAEESQQKKPEEEKNTPGLCVIDPITITRMMAELIGQCLSRMPSEATRDQVKQFAESVQQFTIDTDVYTHHSLVAPVVGILYSMTNGGKDMDAKTNPFMCQFALSNVEWSFEQVKYALTEFDWANIEDTIIASGGSTDGLSKAAAAARIAENAASKLSGEEVPFVLNRKAAFATDPKVLAAFEECAKLRTANCTNDKFDDDSGLIEDGICVICAVNTIDTEFDPCGHTSCEKCIKRHMLNSEKCFFCNDVIKRTKAMKVLA